MWRAIASVCAAILVAPSAPAGHQHDSSFVDIRDHLTKVWADTNVSIAKMRRHLQETHSSFVQNHEDHMAAGHTKLHGLFASLRRDLETVKDSTARILARADRTVAAPSSLLESSGYDGWGAIHDHLQEIWSDTNSSMAELRQHVHSQEAAGSSLVESPHQTDLHHQFAALRKHLQSLQATTNKELQKMRERHVMSKVHEQEATSFLETGGEDSVESYADIRANLEKIWQHTNSSLSELREHVSEAKATSLLEAPTRETKLHSSFAALQSKLQKLHASADAQLKQIRERSSLAKANAEAAEASSPSALAKA